MYVKVFTQIFDSSIAIDWQVRHVFEDFLKLADAEGVVDMTLSAFAARTGLPLDLVTRAIAVLEAPDPNSRTPIHEGRRLLPLYEHKSEGWIITNYGKYRSIANDADRKHGHTEQVRKWKLKDPNTIGSQRGYVYYAKRPTDTDIKIGFSANPWARMREFQTVRPGIEIVALECATFATEQLRHKEFELLRKDGEWFHFGEPLISHVKAIGSVKLKPLLRSNDVAATKPEKKKQRQKKKEMEYPAGSDADFIKMFENWMEVRKGIGKKPKDWDMMFQTQLAWIAKQPRADWPEILSQSIRNGWQGLFPAKQKGRPEGKAPQNHFAL